MNSENFLSTIKGSEYEEEFMNHSFRIAGVPAIVIDLEGKVMFYNKINTLQKELYIKSVSQGMNFFEELIPEKDQSDFFRQYIAFMKSDNRLEMVIRGEIKNKKNRISKVVYVLRKLLNNKLNLLGCLVTIREFSPEEMMHNKIREEKERAEKENQVKSEFLANITHELRTPLNAIIGFNEQLAKTELNEKQAEFVKIIDKSSEHLLSLVNDLLVLSKIEAGQLRIEQIPFNLKSTVYEVYQSLKIKAKEKRINFRIKIDEQLNRVLLGDPFRIRQILINIAGNAIKFTQTGYVEIRCFMLHSGLNRVQAGIEVIDTGIGIPEDKIDVIFDQFRQIDSSSTRKYGGTGLGLTISKRLIKQLGGTIEVESKKRRGSKFSIILPFIPGGENDFIATEEDLVHTGLLKDMRVLLVDDDSVNRLLGKVILEDFGCLIDMAVNGEEAISKARHKKYDLVLLDIHMPDISGTDVAKKIRRGIKNRNVRLIAVTAAVLNEDVENYFEAGFNDYLIKPYREINLFNKISKVFNFNRNPELLSKTEVILKEEKLDYPYNLYNLKKVTKEDWKLLVTMLEIFVNNSQKCIEDFTYYLQKKEWKNIGETAHKILPSYRHLEVNAVVSDLVELKNRILVEQDYTDVPGLVVNLIHAMKRIITLLNSEIRTYKRL